MGRINYCSFLGDKKGITKGVKLDYLFIFRWEIYTLSLNNIENLNYEKISETAEKPCFYKGTFNVDVPADTFVSTEGFKKGLVFINGFNLGRYWSIGSQKNLYLPALLLKKGENELVIFELFKKDLDYIELVEKPLLGN
jgi:beta-galactosidase